LLKVFSTQLNLNINLSVFLFKIGTSEPVKDWQALTTSMLFVLNNFINKRLKVDNYFSTAGGAVGESLHH